MLQAVSVEAADGEARGCVASAASAAFAAFADAAADVADAAAADDAADGWWWHSESWGADRDAAWVLRKLLGDPFAEPARTGDVSNMMMDGASFATDDEEDGKSAAVAQHQADTLDRVHVTDRQQHQRREQGGKGDSLNEQRISPREILILSKVLDCASR